MNRDCYDSLYFNDSKVYAMRKYRSMVHIFKYTSDHVNRHSEKIVILGIQPRKIDRSIVVTTSHFWMMGQDNSVYGVPKNDLKGAKAVINLPTTINNAVICHGCVQGFVVICDVTRGCIYRLNLTAGDTTIIEESVGLTQCITTAGTVDDHIYIVVHGQLILLSEAIHWKSMSNHELSYPRAIIMEAGCQQSSDEPTEQAKDMSRKTQSLFESFTSKAVEVNDDSHPHRNDNKDAAVLRKNLDADHTPATKLFYHGQVQQQAGYHDW